MVDTCTQSLSSPYWIILGASVQGTQHIQESLPLQDAFEFRTEGDNTLLIGVADGLGSAPLSATGARLAVTASLNWLEAALWRGFPQSEQEWEDLIQETVINARAAIEEQAQNQNIGIDDYATTLLLAIATPDILVTGHVGDGAVVAMQSKGPLLTMSEPQNGEYINETFSITSINARLSLHVGFNPRFVDCLALFSDGLQRLALHQQDNSPHEPFFKPLFDQMPGIEDPAKAVSILANFLNSDRVNALTGDDKTLVLARRKSPMGYPEE
jgi:hypothetical protein